MSSLTVGELDLVIEGILTEHISRIEATRTWDF